jgi:hypothetical protein
VTLRQHFARILRDPTLSAVEIAWRWAFALSTISLAIFAMLRLQRAVVILPEEQEMLASRAPLQIAEALLEVWHRIQPLALRLGFIVIPATIVLWIIAATVGRGFVISRIWMPTSTAPRWSSLLVLNILRVLSVFALLAAYVASSRATLLVSSPDAPNYFAAMLVFLILFGLALLVWSFLHWILALACIYAAREQASTFGSLARTARLLRAKGGELASIATLNGTARTLIAVVISLIAAVPLVLYRIPVLFWTVEFVIFVAYCLISDILLLARLSAYVEAMEPAATSVAATEN